jgi:methylamine methyltransferase corrinoid activation protein
MDVLQVTANSIRANHVMFAMDKVFETLYLQELGMWQEGMPVETYNFFLRSMGIQELPSKFRPAEVHRIVDRDIPVLGKKGLKILRDIGLTITGCFEGCIGCRKCEEECPENALTISESGSDYTVTVRSDLCNGTACLRCDRICPEKVFMFKDLRIEEKK